MGQYTINNIELRAEDLKFNIDNIYRALNTKIKSSPKTLDQVPEWILGIPDPPTEEPLTITPTIDRQEISVGSEIKYNPITVEPVTSAVDSNIQPENIKAGISILGVFGTLSGGTSNNFVVPNGMKFALSTFTNFPTNVDFSSVTTMDQMFYSCSQLTTIPQLNTSNVIDMSNMFSGCSQLTTIPLLDTSNVTNMGGMFGSCSKLTTIPLLDTSNVTDMNSMFSGCDQLTTIPQLNTSNVTDMNSMFSGCSQLTTIPLLDTSNVISIGKMFSGCSSLTTIPQLNTSNVRDMGGTFMDCINLTTIPQLNTSKVEYMDEIFSNCTNLTTVEGIDFSGLTSPLYNLFGYASSMPNLTRFIVNGKINVSISGEGNIYMLTSIDYDSVKSILAAADRTDNTNAKELAFNRTIPDQNGELAALVSSCTTKGWTITGLTIQ